MMTLAERLTKSRKGSVGCTVLVMVTAKLLISCGGSSTAVQTNTITTDSEEFSAGTMQRADNIITAWTQWLEQSDPSRASLSITYQGRLVSSHSIGSQPEDPAPVASLSKAITGICVATLVDNGQLTFETPIQSVLPDLNSTATIASLLTHTSGLRVDITQEPANYPGVDQEYLMWVAQQELNAAGTNTEDNSYHYNNSNYAILGAMIARTTGQSYEQSCKELVLEPAGIMNAGLNPDWRIMSAWGGWKLSSIDFQKFLATYFTEAAVLNHDPFTQPHTPLTDQVYYGMGYLFRQGRNGGYNFWHNGQWHSNYGGTRHRFSAFFASWDNGWAVATNQNISAINGELPALDSALANAAHQP